MLIPLFLFILYFHQWYHELSAYGFDHIYPLQCATLFCFPFSSSFMCGVGWPYWSLFLTPFQEDKTTGPENGTICCFLQETMQRAPAICIANWWYNFQSGGTIPF